MWPFVLAHITITDNRGLSIWSSFRVMPRLELNGAQPNVLSAGWGGWMIRSRKEPCLRFPPMFGIGGKCGNDQLDQADFNAWFQLSLPSQPVKTMWNLHVVWSYNDLTATSLERWLVEASIPKSPNISGWWIIKFAEIIHQFASGFKHLRTHTHPYPTYILAIIAVDIHGYIPCIYSGIYRYIQMSLRHWHGSPVMTHLSAPGKSSEGSVVTHNSSWARKAFGGSSPWC